LPKYRTLNFQFYFQKAMMSEHSFAISRLDAPEFCQKFPALPRKGAGNAGRSMRPQPGGQKKQPHQ
jgi:hypothetical protein